MISQIKIISKETIIYGIGSTAGSFVSFLLLPLYTRFLTPEDYGYLTIFSVFQSIIEITAIFGLSSGLFRYYLMAKDDVERKTILVTCFWSQLLFIFILALITLPLVNQLSYIFFKTYKYSQYFILVTVTGILSAFGSFIFSFMRAKRKPIFFSITQIIRVMLLMLVNVFFVVVLKYKYSGIIAGNFIVAIITSTLVLAWFSRFIGFSFSRSFFKRLIFFISPIYIVNVFSFLLNFSDRFFLNHFLSKTEVGLYSFGNKLGTIVMVGLIAPFSTAVVPYALSIAKEGYFKETFSKIMKYFLLILSYLSICIFYFSKEIVILVSHSSYISASEIIGPILLSSIFYGLYYNLSIAIDIVEKTYLVMIVVFFGAIVSIGVNYFTIPYLGMYGSALASCASNGFMFLFVYYFCQKYFPIHYEVSAFFKLTAIIVIYIILFFWVSQVVENNITIIYIKIFLCFIFPFLLFVLRVFDRNERIYLKKYLNTIITIKN